MRMLSYLLLGSMPRRLTQLNRMDTNSPLCCFQGSTILKSNQHFYRCFSLRTETENQKAPKVETISKEFIKPSNATPQHSRTYEVSLFDQLFPSACSSFVYFYTNNHQNGNESILERRQLLKQSLSETLSKFYPLAGRIKDSRTIDCNDDGVYYVEAKVDDNLSDFLGHPANKFIHQLLPLDPNSEELFSRKDLAMIQVTVFGCGGISIGLYASHKIMDGYSISTFLKTWSATARGSSEQINPVFISSSDFPSNPTLPQDATLMLFPQPAYRTKIVTKRFLFPRSSIMTLKQKADASRVWCVTALIWKCVISASKKINVTLKSSTMTVGVNLRDKISPPAPSNSIGNIVFATHVPIECIESDDLELDSIAQRLKAATNQFSGEVAEKWKETLLSTPEAILNETKEWYSDKNAKHVGVSSFATSWTYETDFGWGKPIWVCVGSGDSLSQLENFVVLMHTKCGTGIEAWVTLSEEEMRIFECDPELLAFASLNANPLQLC